MTRLAAVAMVGVLVGILGCDSPPPVGRKQIAIDTRHVAFTEGGQWRRGRIIRIDTTPPLECITMDIGSGTDSRTLSCRTLDEEGGGDE